MNMNIERVGRMSTSFTWNRCTQQRKVTDASLHGLMVLAMLPALLALNFRQRGEQTSTTGKMVWGHVATPELNTHETFHGPLKPKQVPSPKCLMVGTERFNLLLQEGDATV